MKVGIIGCGHIATMYIPYVLVQPDARIMGLADASEARARELAAHFGIVDVYPTLRDLLDAERPDVVHILTPPQTHAALAMEAMEAVARRHGVKLCVDHNRLFDPAFVRAKALVE
jgi:predicted dehydrogenase